MNTQTSTAFLQNESEFELVFREFYQPLCAFAYGYTNDPDIAEEIVQDTFTNLWGKAASIEIRTTVKSYLFGAIRNACLNHLKHEKVKQAHAEYEQLRVRNEQTDFMELDELQAHINRAMARLPEKCRQVFEMSRFEEKKYQEIADELGISIKTVENQMGKALKTMREELGQYLPVLLMMFFLGMFK